MTSAERQYLQKVLELYRRFPGTTGRLGPHDRRFASLLFHQRVPLDVVEIAILLGVLRRLASANASQLQPVRSLLYFKPLVEEVLADTKARDPSYVAYLLRKLPQLAKRAPEVRQPPPRRQRPRTPSTPTAKQLSFPF